MPERYFIKFPQIEYANATCVDITKRPILSDKLTLNPSVFEQYTIKYNTRPDIVAENFYDDSMYDWLVYLNNGIIDPYYGWTMDDNDFEQHIVNKYGSVAEAMKRIYLYKLNWADTDAEITPSYYNTNLPDGLKKYYTPRFGQDNKIVSYIRKSDNTATNTNKLIQFDVSFETGNTFYVNEIVDIKDKDTATIVGGGEITFSNSTTIVIKNISGNTSANNLVIGESSNSIANISLSTTLQENITDDVAVYWSPVYYYEYEVELNQATKNIRLLQPNYALEAAEELRTSMKG
jgi:hypothetical protein